MAGVWCYGMLFYLSTAGMISPSLPVNDRQQEFFQKVFGGWGIVCYPVVNLFFVFCLAAAVHQFAVNAVVSNRVLRWLIGCAIAVGLAMCAGLFWVFLPK